MSVFNNGFVLNAINDCGKAKWDMHGLVYGTCISNHVDPWEKCGVDTVS